ncbi:MULTISPECIES: LacI family DNA-binding transcriptional regulator [unclassified Streptomyces]|uniref:LacI family DNA-binding transcriptional regulator n=1 Tax=unclassified Streptomyces TaxID=2593676 RepID=UPI000DBA4044|nr:MULTISPECIES: LacI family DNA-binding transcriptional regulator [unclassified Streptomyces]MYT73415.1 substrate-binding domain-containing protein [Streptomyces sp. SID8367]RAJ84942.1 DNA-binding LacI/PurR family transcriptional regulator [Streptomyces sp. PsTaAH-137]
MSDQRVTIKDVAARAGVSRAAVSLAFGGNPGLSDATRAHILDIARSMGRHPDRSAPARNPVDSRTISLVVRRPAQQLGLEPFYMAFVSGLESVVSDRRGAVLLRLVKTLDEEIDLASHWWRTRRIAGSVLVDFREHDPRGPVLARLGIPAVAIAHPALARPFTSLWTDDATAVGEAVRYLAALGHRSIARVGGAPELGHSVIRCAAFKKTMAELGLGAGQQLDTDFSGAAGARATRSLLTAVRRPTAIVYDNDVMAVAGLAVATEMGLRVPTDLSLLAWDDSQLCRLTHPALSAMSHDIHAFGAEAARTLYALIAGDRVRGHPVPAPVLTPRGSTAAPGHPD